MAISGGQALRRLVMSGMKPGCANRRKIVATNDVSVQCACNIRWGHASKIALAKWAQVADI